MMSTSSARSLSPPMVKYTPAISDTLSPLSDQQCRHKRALSGNQLTKPDDFLLPSSLRSPLQSAHKKISKGKSIPYQDYTITGNSGLSISSAYGMNERRSSMTCPVFESPLSSASASTSSASINNIYPDTNSASSSASSIQSLNIQRAPSPQPSNLTTEDVFNSLEKEQDAIVLKLIKEIAGLREENKLLRQRLLHRNNDCANCANSRRSSTNSTTTSSVQGR